MSSTNVKTFTTTSLLALFAAITPSVRAHGYVQRITDGSNTYQGLQDDWNKPGGSPILIGDYNTPLYDVWSSQIACGINPQAAQSVAQLSVGTTLWINWVTHGDNTNQPQKHWTHNEGTHRAFIAPCIGSCQTTNPNDVEWTELPGQYVGNGWQTYNGAWPVSTLAAGNSWSVQIPDLPTGDYLLRDELTALHYSTQPYQPPTDAVGHGYGTEFYPACMAFHVNGGGSFDMSQAVKFPGAYTVDQAGHYNPDLWANPNSVIISSLNSQARSDYTPSNSGGSNSGGNTSNGGSTSNGGTTNSSSGSSNGSGSTTGPACRTRRKKRSAKFSRRHHALSH